MSQIDSDSTTTVKAAVPSFEAKARDGRIGALGVPPRGDRAVLAELPNSTRWKGVKVRGGRAGIEVERKGDPGAWLCDLWLAELLAQKLTPAVARGRAETGPRVPCPIPVRRPLTTAPSYPLYGPKSATSIPTF